MLIKCKQKREGGSKIEIGGSTYHFKPEAGDGDHVCEVADKNHIGRFLSITEGYELAGDDKPVEPDKPDPVNPENNGGEGDGTDDSNTDDGEKTDGSSDGDAGESGDSGTDGSETGDQGVDVPDVSAMNKDELMFLANERGITVNDKSPVPTLRKTIANALEVQANQ